MDVKLGEVFDLFYLKIFEPTRFLSIVVYSRTCDQPITKQLAHIFLSDNLQKHELSSKFNF